MPQDDSPRTFGISDPDADAVPGGTTQVESQPEAAAAGSWNFQEALPGMLLVAGVMLATLVVMRAAWRASARNKAAAQDPSNQPPERLEQIRADAAQRAVVQSFEADAEELTRRLSAMLDNKAARMQLLIEEANSAIDRLTRAVAESEGHPKMTPDSAQDREFVDPSHRQICLMADQGSTPDEIAARLDRPVGEVELVLNLNGRRKLRGA